MLPLNEFLREYRSPLSKFINELVDVDDPGDYYTEIMGKDIYEVLRNLRCIITISPNELYYLHSLFISNLDAIVSYHLDFEKELADQQTRGDCRACIFPPSS